MDLDLDRQTIVEIVVAVVPVFSLAAFIVYVGLEYSTNGDLSSQGGLIIVVGLVLFIFAMAGIGYWLANTDFDEGRPNGS